MHTHPTSGTTLSDHYASLLAAQESSGLSMQRFAALHGVSACTLYMWRRRLSAAASGAADDAPRLVAVDVVGSVRPAEVGTADDRYEIQLANGLSLRVPTDFVAARVAELVSTLRTC
jgi:transposase-like protein